jgi:hypothetical protein
MLTPKLFTSFELGGPGAQPRRGILSDTDMTPAAADKAWQTGPTLEAMYRFMLSLIPRVERFPRSQMFLLADRIQSTALDVLERLIEAPYTRARQVALY